jgi:hypothetical protein
LGDACGNVPAHRNSHQNSQQSKSIFSLLLCLLLPWQLLGGYGARSCLMAASSGFQYSPENAAMGDALCIALAHHHGYRNGQQRKWFVSHHHFFALS